MKNTFGTNVAVTIFGESHGEMIGIVIDGLAPGIKVDNDFISSRLTLRRPAGKISTARQEEDKYSIVSGVFEGRTTGTPICILIPNTSAKSRDYSETRFLARPGHADYTAFTKYHGYEDFRGGGHFSGRITAALVAAGGILIPALNEKGIKIGTHISRLAGISDRGFENLDEDIDTLSNKTFAVLDEEKGSKMQAAITAAAREGDSVGGILESAVTGLPVGLGEPWFDTMEGLLSHALFSIPAVKGIEFGAGFDMVDSKGSEFNDDFCMSEGKVKTRTNNNGGINGGITNGMPLLIRLAVKPTPSIFKKQNTVNFMESKDASLKINGRHDPAIIHRARIVADSVISMVLCDVLAGRYGTDWITEG